VATRKNMTWWKAPSLVWEAMVYLFEGEVPTEMALLDLSYLSQTGQELSTTELAKRWAWSRSRAYRFAKENSDGTKAERKRNESGTAKPPEHAVLGGQGGTKAERKRNDSGTIEGSLVTLTKEKRREESIINKTKKPSKKPKRVSPVQEAKRLAISSWCEEYKAHTGKSYPMSGRDTNKTSTETLGRLATEDEDEYRRVARVYLKAKDGKREAWIGSCPPGAPSLYQFGQYFGEFSQMTPPRTRGQHDETRQTRTTRVGRKTWED
jgi:hypothetical protein